MKRAWSPTTLAVGVFLLTGLTAYCSYSPDLDEYDVQAKLKTQQEEIEALQKELERREAARKAQGIELKINEYEIKRAKARQIYKEGR